AVGSPPPMAVALMRAWVDAGAALVATPDGNGTIPFPGAAIYAEFRTTLQQATFGDELGSAVPTMNYPSTNAGYAEDDHGSLVSPDALLLRALSQSGPVAGATPPAGLLTVSRNYFDDVATPAPQARAEVLVAALQAAIDALTTRFGTADQTQWL